MNIIKFVYFIIYPFISDLAKYFTNLAFVQFYLFILFVCFTVVCSPPGITIICGLSVLWELLRTFRDPLETHASAPHLTLSPYLVIIIFLIQLLNSRQKLLSLALKSSSPPPSHSLSSALLFSFSLSLRALESSRQALHGADTTSLTPQEVNALCYFRCSPVDVNMNIGRRRGRGRRRRSRRRRRRGSSLNNFLHIPRQRWNIAYRLLSSLS